MLPKNLRNTLFDKLSGVTMREAFTPISAARADGLVAQVLAQSAQDFFINGTITCHAAQPRLMAGMWSGGRETVLVEDTLPSWEKIAMGAAISQENQCPYCEDFLLSLTHGAGEDDVAVGIRKGEDARLQKPQVQARLAWARATIHEDDAPLLAAPFHAEALPEAVGTALVFCYTNKMSDFAMDGSPVPAIGRGASLRFFGGELRESAKQRLEPGMSLALLPEAELPSDLSWARGNPRVADSLARWAAEVDREAARVMSAETLAWLHERLDAWRFGHPPISRSWVADDLGALQGPDRDLARLALVVAKASYQVDDTLIAQAARHLPDESSLVALGAWASLAGARRIASRAARLATTTTTLRESV